MYARFVRLGHIIIYNFLIGKVTYIFICTRFTYIVWVTVIHYYVKICKYMSVLISYYAKNHWTALFVYFNRLQFILKKENNMQIYYINYIKKYIMLYLVNLAQGTTNQIHTQNILISHCFFFNHLQFVSCLNNMCNE